MKASEIIEIVSRINVGAGFALWEFKLDAVETRPGSVQVAVSARVPHRDTGRVGPLGQVLELHCSTYGWGEGARVIGDVRKLLREFVLHELDESITFDGRRLFDPHA